MKIDEQIHSDPTYIKESKEFIKDALYKGRDVIQMPNGDIIISETKMISSRFRWDSKKGSMVLETTLEVDLNQS